MYIGALHFFLSLSPLLSCSLFSSINIRIYIDNEKHRHKFIFSRRRRQSSILHHHHHHLRPKACYSNVCWYPVSLKYTLVPLKNNNNSMKKKKKKENTNNKNNALSSFSSVHTYKYTCQEHIEDRVRMMLLMMIFMQFSCRYLLYKITSSRRFILIVLCSKKQDVKWFRS